MKNHISKQQIKFKNQLSHLHALVGMPIRNDHKLSISERRAQDRYLLAQQSLDFEPKRKGLIKLVFVWLKSKLSIAINPIAEPANQPITKHQHFELIKKQCNKEVKKCW